MNEPHCDFCEAYAASQAAQLRERFAALAADNAALRGALQGAVDRLHEDERLDLRNEYDDAVIEAMSAALSHPGGAVLLAAMALADFILADFNETQVCPHCDPQEPDGHFEECPLDAYSKAKQEATECDTSE